MAQWDPKKIAISCFVLVSFILYSFSMRHDDTHTVIAPNKTATNVSTANSSISASQTPTSASGSSASSSAPATLKYKDGKYVGSVADAFYGNVQVQTTIIDGKITSVDFLQYPNDRPNSVYINTQAMPYLKQEAIKAQSAQVDGVSGATDTSQAFVESLTAALNKAM